MKSRKQKLHYDERIKQISMQQAKEYFLKRPNAKWMSANVGETEFYLIENVKEKEVKVPVIKTITKYILKEIPKEIPVEITKEVEKIITQVVTKVVIKERKKVVYRQTPEYLKLKREAQSLTAQVKKAEHDKKTSQLESEIKKLREDLEKKEAQLESESKKHKEELDKKDIDITDKIRRKNSINIIKETESILNSIKKETKSPVIFARLPSVKLDYVSWCFFIYGTQTGIAVCCFLCNYSTGTIMMDNGKQNEMLKFLNRNFSPDTYISIDMVLNVVKMYKNIQNVDYVEKFNIPDE